MGKFEVLVISYIFAMNIKISFNMFTFMETHSLMQLQFTVLTMLTFYLNLILLYLIFALKRLKTQRVKSHLSVDMFMACWNCWVIEALAMPPKELRSF